MPKWSDLFKIWNYAFRDDPIETRAKKDISGAGVTQPDAIPDIRQDGSFWGGGRGLIKLRDTNDFVDLSSVTNRISRYKEYERLRSVSEIEAVMDTYADETCLAGHMIVNTVFFGPQTIKWLAENKSGERFLVYCWDGDKKDYTIGWAYDARKVKTARTIRIKLDDGTNFIATPEHRVLLHNGDWTMTGLLQFGDELMPFYREQPNLYFNDKLKTNQHPRIFSLVDGWKTERQFVDEWRTGKSLKTPATDIVRMLCAGATIEETAKVTHHDRDTLRSILKKEGFSLKELRQLGKKENCRRVIGVEEWKEIDVYDLSVEKHKNFCGESIVYHNCQRGENGHIFEIRCANEFAKEEAEFLCFHPEMLNFDDPSVGWNYVKNTCIQGDHFFEVVIDAENPKKGVVALLPLPPDSMYRIETTKGKLVEFQQSNEGPDYQSLTRVPVTQATEADLMQATAVRFTADQIVHTKIGDDRRTFYPYGVSLIEAARGPAHQLRLMEDSMVVYRLSRAPERRVFYIDVGTLSPARAEAFMERIKDQFRKKKVAPSRGGGPGASSVEERWHPPAIDEDYWLPIRPNATNTRIDTLQGAQNLGEIDDALYFRNKLFTALKFPLNYFSTEDANATKTSLSSQNVRFARTIERLQAHFSKAVVQIITTHLKLRGVPKEDFEDLQVIWTPPSEYRELSKQELMNNRIGWASNLKGSMIMADFDILTGILKYTEEEAAGMQARLKIQKLEDFKLQVLAQNPQLLGVGLPSNDEQQMGTEAGGPSPDLTQPPGGAPPPPEEGAAGAPVQNNPKPSGNGGMALAEVTPEEIKKYDLEIQNYDLEQDTEERDYSEE
ncbi:MAG: portal protein [Proteobacteria bacterium]|jgi:hypothetical protein|nr:portal protein [Pseudomonadota bacterium]